MERCHASRCDQQSNWVYSRLVPMPSVCTSLLQVDSKSFCAYGNKNCRSNVILIPCGRTMSGARDVYVTLFYDLE